MRFIDSLLGHDISDSNLQLNNHGHRCKDLEDINLHNYLLFAGDNVALDFNLPIEETYPYIVSKQLGMDYYNLSMFNGGVECLKFNLLSWTAKIKQAPKAIIISSEFLNSFLVCDQNYMSLRECDFKDSTTSDIFARGNYNGFFSARNELFDRIAHKSTNTQIYQIVFKDKQSALQRNVVNIEHDGDIFDHAYTASLVVQKIKSRMRAIAP